MSGVLVVPSRDEFLALAADVRRVNRSLESIGITERLTYEFRTVPGAGGGREYRVTLSHGKAEREALSVVVTAVERIRRKGGGLTASGAHVRSSGKMSAIVASLACGPSALFSGADYKRVEAAERLLLLRRDMERDRVRAEERKALKRRRHSRAVEALVASGTPRAEADRSVRQRHAEEDKQVELHRRAAEEQAESWEAARCAARERAARSVVWA